MLVCTACEVRALSPHPDVTDCRRRPGVCDSANGYCEYGSMPFCDDCAREYSSAQLIVRLNDAVARVALREACSPCASSDVEDDDSLVEYERNMIDGIEHMASRDLESMAQSAFTLNKTPFGEFGQLSARA